MIHKSSIDLRRYPRAVREANPAALLDHVHRDERDAKRTLLDRHAADGRRVHAIVYTWQLRIKVAGGLRVMRAWMPGQDVPVDAEVLELVARACLAAPTAPRSALLQPKGVG